MEIQDSIKLLKVSKQSRKLALLKGFPGKIDDKIELKFCFASNYERGEKDSAQVEISVTKHFKTLFKASIKKDSIRIDEFKGEKLGHIFYNLFNKRISKCRSLQANFGFAYQSPKEIRDSEKFMKTFLKNYGNFLENVKNFQSVELFGSAHHSLGFLAQFSTEHVENLKFQLHWDKKKDLDTVLAHEVFQNCQVFTWNTATDSYPMKLVRDIYSKTSAQYIVADFECLLKLKRLLKTFAQLGIPKDRGSMVIKHDGIDAFEAKDDFKELTTTYAQSLGLKRITGTSKRAVIMRKFFEDLSERELSDALPATFTDEVEWSGKMVKIKKKPQFRYFEKKIVDRETLVCAIVLLDGTETYGACEMQVLMTTLNE
ncbi:unnamed protein product, partial [Mesorhabditis belari]|uniref:Uncharacterized protein n=1 Tax=Mesorhabditis belari TaxID=2138241 RepID=A0AAF3EJ54_9BILA